MNEFGTPMSEAEMSMNPNPAKAMMQDQLATAGMENYGFWGAVAGGAIGAVGSLIGGSKSAKAASKQAKKQNEAAQRQLKYDTSRWKMEKDKIKADRKWYIEGNKIKNRNEKRAAKFQDATNLAVYKQQLQIRRAEQQSLDQQYNKSEQIFDKQLGFNALSAINATESEDRHLQEIHAESTFDAQKQRLEYLQNEGELRARGITGRSASKSHQALAASFGQQVAMLNESLESAGRNTRASLKEIRLDKFSADLAAYAQKMLKPGELPKPIIPFKTPIAEFQNPRALGEYDFGPKPVLGAMASPSAAAQQAWGAAIPGIASAVGKGVGELI